MNNKSIIKLVITALMAGLCYVVFTFIQIKIPTPAGYTSFHLGNVFCVLAALLIDGVSGGFAGAIGMGIADLLDPAYVLTAPKTIILKFLIGYIAGTLAHKTFKIEEITDSKKQKKYILISITIAMLFNIIAEPIFSYLYYSVILGNVDKAASYITIAKWITTATNSILTIIISYILYFALIKHTDTNKFK